MMNPPQLQRTSLDAQAYLPLTPAHRKWLHRLASILAPNRKQETWFTRFVAFFFVVPFAPLTPMDIQYQTYLYEVFHRSRLAQTMHLLLFPLVNLAVMVGLAQFTFGPHPEAHLVNPLALNGALVFALGLAIWYTCLAIRARSLSWGIAMIATVLALWCGANVIYGLTFTLDPALRTIAQPTPLAFNPWLWAAVLPVLIAASHVTEPDVPPRVSGTARWVPLADYLLGQKDHRIPAIASIQRIARLVFQFFSGGCAEFLAAQRLMPIALLRLLWAIGLARHFQPGVEEARRAVAQGQPAVDYVGHGGGTRLNCKGD